MDQGIRHRMLIMTSEYHGWVDEAIRVHRELTLNREALEAQKVKLVEGIVWGPNEQARKAQMEAALADPVYQDRLAHSRDLEEALKAGQMRLEALRFERDILAVIANTEGHDALAAASAGAVYGTLERLSPGTSDTRD